MARQRGTQNYQTWKAKMQAYLIARRAAASIPGLSDAERIAMLPEPPPKNPVYEARFWLDDYES